MNVVSAFNPSLFSSSSFTASKSVDDFLRKHHYLGPSRRGFAWRDEYGAMIFANPSSRRLPQFSWLELVRWCIVSDELNAGSRQWSTVRRAVFETLPDITTVVSYSDPAMGHDGALYRACGWLWAPTWHRLRPPPSGNGDWGSGRQAVKDRWAFPLRPDEKREALLRVQDTSVERRMPWASYSEPRIRRGRVVIGSGGGDYARWRRETTSCAEDVPL